MVKAGNVWISQVNYFHSTILDMIAALCMGAMTSMKTDVVWLLYYIDHYSDIISFSRLVATDIIHKKKRSKNNPILCVRSL